MLSFHRSIDRIRFWSHGCSQYLVVQRDPATMIGLPSRKQRQDYGLPPQQNVVARSHKYNSTRSNRLGIFFTFPWKKNREENWKKYWGVLRNHCHCSRYLTPSVTRNSDWVTSDIVPQRNALKWLFNLYSVVLFLETGPTTLWGNVSWLLNAGSQVKSNNKLVLEEINPSQHTLCVIRAPTFLLPTCFFLYSCWRLNT